MLHAIELMSKLRAAGQQQVSDFSFVDQDGEQVEVRVTQIDPARTNNNSDML